MLWIGIALVAHFMNALVFVVDKSLLSSGNSVVNNPAKYAALSGLVAAGAAVVLPFGFVLPNFFVLTWSLIGGLFWIAALWLFFKALKNGESSRVVPIAGSTVPIFTLIISALVLGESFSGKQLLVVLALIAGGVLLSIKFGKAAAVSKEVLTAAIFSGTAFAAHFVTVDYLYANFGPFASAFAYNRLGVGFVALVLFIYVSKKTTPSRKAGHPSFVRRGKKAATHGAILVGSAFIGSKVFAAVALLLQSYAINLGDVTIVNALQGTQYVFLLILAFAISMWLPKLFKEEINRVAIGQKIIGLAVIVLGLVLLV